jgi:hypothetical protein
VDLVRRLTAIFLKWLGAKLGPMEKFAPK